MVSYFLRCSLLCMLAIRSGAWSLSTPLKRNKATRESRLYVNRGGTTNDWVALANEKKINNNQYYSDEYGYGDTQYNSNNYYNQGQQVQYSATMNGYNNGGSLFGQGSSYQRQGGYPKSGRLAGSYQRQGEYPKSGRLAGAFSSALNASKKFSKNVDNVVEKFMTPTIWKSSRGTTGILRKGTNDIMRTDVPKSIAVEALVYQALEIVAYDRYAVQNLLRAGDNWIGLASDAQSLFSVSTSSSANVVNGQRVAGNKLQMGMRLNCEPWTMWLSAENGILQDIILQNTLTKLEYQVAIPVHQYSNTNSESGYYFTNSFSAKNQYKNNKKNNNRNSSIKTKY